MSEDECTPTLNDSTQAALAKKYEAEAELFRAEAEYNRAMVREQEAKNIAQDAKTREEAAASTKLALVYERQIETIMGEDEYRRVYQFRGPVTTGSTEKAMIFLNAWHAANPAQDWEIHLFTPGGDMYAGMRFLDYLSVFKKTHKITTVSMGATMSMGAILLQGGTWRRMGRESTLLIHKGSLSGWIEDSIDNVFDQMDFIKKRHERIAKLFEERAKASNAPHPITAKQIKAKWERKDWYLDSDECLDLGIVDEVL